MSNKRRRGGNPRKNPIQHIPPKKDPPSGKLGFLWPGGINGHKRAVQVIDDREEGIAIARTQAFIRAVIGSRENLTLSESVLALAWSTRTGPYRMRKEAIPSMAGLGTNLEIPPAFSLPKGWHMPQYDRLQPGEVVLFLALSLAYSSFVRFSIIEATKQILDVANLIYPTVVILVTDTGPRNLPVNGRDEEVGCFLVTRAQVGSLQTEYARMGYIRHPDGTYQPTKVEVMVDDPRTEIRPTFFPSADTFVIDVQAPEYLPLVQAMRHHAIMSHRTMACPPFFKFPVDEEDGLTPQHTELQSRIEAALEDVRNNAAPHCPATVTEEYWHNVWRSTCCLIGLSGIDMAIADCRKSWGILENTGAGPIWQSQ